MPVFHRSFKGSNGDAEHFFIITAAENLTLNEQLSSLHTHYFAAQQDLGLSPQTAIFKRLFLSDAANQAKTVLSHPLALESDDNPVALSLIEQPPLPSAKVALLAYHIDGPTPLIKKRLAPNHLAVDKNGLCHIWSTQLCCEGHSPPCAETQTNALFDRLTQRLASVGGNLKDNCLRTWLYIKDVDVFYHGLVKSRMELFTREGLTDETHYIASTGIEGGCRFPRDLVSMDAYSVLGLQRDQVSYLNDLEQLSLTKDYNVTFERGTRIAYADRTHSLISGTASIDKFGKTLYVGDVMRQAERALDNVEALLKAGKSTLNDLMYLIVYVRDASDFARIKTFFDERLPHTPTLIVKGAVCRPEWLVEIEGIAIAAHNQPNTPSF